MSEFENDEHYYLNYVDYLKEGQEDYKFNQEDDRRIRDYGSALSRGLKEGTTTFQAYENFLGSVTALREYFSPADSNLYSDVEANLLEFEQVLFTVPPGLTNEEWNGLTENEKKEKLEEYEEDDKEGFRQEMRNRCEMIFLAVEFQLEGHWLQSKYYREGVGRLNAEVEQRRKIAAQTTGNAGSATGSATGSAAESAAE